MDLRLILYSLREAAAGAGAAGDPTGAVRLSGDFDGGNGEGYLLRFANGVCLADRPSGSIGYRCFFFPPEAVEVTAREDGDRNGAAVLAAGGRSFPVACSSAESGALAAALAGLSAPAAADAVSTAALWSAAMMFAAGADGELPPEQEQMVRRLALSREALQAGVAFYQEHSPEELARRLSRLGAEHKDSLLINMLELMMSDGDYRTVEQRLLRDFAGALGVPEARRKQLEEIVMTKNRYPILFG